jgi:hypothetical protein
MRITLWGALFETHVGSATRSGAVFTDDGRIRADNGDLTWIISKSTHCAAAAQIESQANLESVFRDADPL